MKKIKKLVITIVSTCLLFSVSGQVSYAQEINTQNYEISNEEFDTQNDLLITDSKLSSNGPEDSHQQFVAQALKILENDKGRGAVEFYDEYKSDFLKYCDQPDYDEGDHAFAYHFYNPYTKKNYLSSILPASKTTAMTKFKEHMKNAVKSGKEDEKYAMHELGRAIHFLTDVNVPHHAANLVAVVTNHSKYEKYISENNSIFFVDTSDAYDKYENLSFDDYCTELLDECAKNSYSYKELATSKDKADWEKAARPTLKLAQENIASLLYRFEKEIEK